MKNPISKQVVNHLEYLGYVVEDVTEKENKENLDFILGTSERKSNLLVRISKDNTIFISVRYTIFNSNEIITEKFLNALNTLNSISIHTKVYYKENDKKEVDLIIETFIINYDKLSLTTVIDALESDVRISLKDLQEYYLPKPKTDYGQITIDALRRATKDEENISSRIGF